jgi:ATP-binding cassette subfamily B protein
MIVSKFRSLLADPDSAVAMIHRLLIQQAAPQWRRYVVALVLMGVAAASTAASVYLLGGVINVAYIDRDLKMVIMLAIAAAALMLVKAAASYGHAVLLARIGNRIVAENQRLMFNSLIRQNLEFFAKRHSSEFMARLSFGAQAANGVINLFIISFGRDLLTLIALIVVMAIQDPVMSFLSFVVAPPAFLVLRKLIRRVNRVVRNQFTGGIRILETLQETVQGIRVVKAFTLEDVMRERLDANVAALEHESNRLARLSNRASPLMEALGALAICLVLIYGGYRVLATGATPGQFTSFIAAFMMAYEPAKRLARFNLDLHALLVGVQILFEIIDAPQTEPDDSNKPALALADARVEFERV